MNENPNTAENPSLLLARYRQFVSKTNEWTPIQDLLADRNVSEEQFFSIIPRQVAEFALLLRTPVTYHALSATAPEQLAASLKEAKESADRHFKGIESHPLLLESMQARVQRSASTRPRAGSISALTEFTEFHASPMWLEGTSDLTPIVAISLLSGSKLILKTTIDWDDLSFLCSATVSLLRDEFARAAKMLEKQTLDIAFKDVLSERILEMKAMLGDVERSAEKLGLQIAKGQDTAAKFKA